VVVKTALITWNGRIAPVFDVAAEALVFELEGSEIVSREYAALPVNSAMDKIIYLSGLGIEVLVCGAISNHSRNFARTYGIDVYSLVAGDTEQVLQAYIAGNLDRTGFAMPGCGRGRRNRRGGSCRRNRRNY
jgi:predicted Fe-Mo cluster-binding NifX family protein